MTAEIALLNRKAVALAADSIATLAGPNNGVIKTYDSAEKIFELSRNMPLGLMTYNSTEFLQIPIEILVREFRKVFDDDVTKINEIWPKFHKFLQDESKGFSGLGKHIFSNLDNLVSPILKSLQESTNLTSELYLVNKKIDGYGRNNLNGCNEDKFKKFCRNCALELLDNKFPILRSKLEQHELPISLILDLIIKIIKSRYKTSEYVGLVFAGFGKEDRFPSLYYVEIDGFYFGKARVIKSKTVAISRNKLHSLIVPFAQKLMFDRFISGIDDKYEEQILQILHNTTCEVLDDIQNLTNVVKDKIVQNTMSIFSRDLLRHKNSTFLENISFVDHLSKKDLAEYASSLVELSSRYNKYTYGIETVGGPIDVAILTKNEGFIWVSRKKYFEINQHPSYCHRRELSLF